MSSSELTSRLRHTSTHTLRPLISITTGLLHSLFPTNLLHYYSLTAVELDALAHFYHQRTPSELSFKYPLPVVQRWYAEASSSPATDKEMKGIQECIWPEKVDSGKAAEVEARL